MQKLTPYVLLASALAFSCGDDPAGDGGGGGGGGDPEVTFLVIASDALEASAGRWAEFRAAGGHEVELVRIKTTGDVTPGKPWKASDASIKHVYWEITVKNTSSVPMTGVMVDFAFADNGGGLPESLKVTGGGATWTVNNLTDLIATFGGTIPAGESITFRADFVTPNNASGNVSAAVYAGSTLIGTTGKQGF